MKHGKGKGRTMAKKNLPMIPELAGFHRGLGMQGKESSSYGIETDSTGVNSEDRQGGHPGILKPLSISWFCFL